MRRVLFAVALLGFTSISVKAAATGKSVYGVTHVDIGGRGVLAKATSLIREFQADSLHDPGVVRFEILQQDGHPNHFTILEVWQSRQAFNAHLAAPHTRSFRQKLQPMLGSPFRERLHRLL